jgi:rhodanese-related sulfurtransferase
MEQRKPTTMRVDSEAPNIAVIEFVNGNTWPEVFAAFDQEIAYAKSYDAPVGVIMDIRFAPDPPDNTTLVKAQQLFNQQPRNVKLFVLCGGSRFSQVVATILRNAGLVNMHFASTFEEARTLILNELKQEN